ncbi:MAG TPA: hypothetical protein VFA48_05750 [Gammaproteobacteria bacterium]|nr:hypothetical protein [Gammaproteobacteria bacterium]
MLNVANLLGPLALGLSALVAGYRLIRRHPETVWTPYAWFLAAIVLFYSMGPLIYPLAGSRTLAYAQSLAPVDASQLLRTNLLNAVGILALLVGFRIGRAWPRLRNRDAAGMRARSPALTKTVALTFLAIGGVLQYLVILPTQFGLYHLVMPGMIKNLGDLYLLGLMVLAYIVAKGSRAWQLPFIGLWTLQVVTSFLLFSKHQLILSIALPALGAYLAHRRVSHLLAWSLVICVVYFSVGQLVLYGRTQINAQTGDINHATLMQRARIVRTWFQEGMPSANAATSAGATGWARLYYAPQQAFAMNRHDTGQTGHTLRYLDIVLIPRLIWPGKPVISDMGAGFYELVTGRRGSHLAPGIFAEGYWDYGWPGVIGLGLIAGLAFGVLSSLSVGWMRRGAFEYLPGVLLGINMGIVGTTQFFVASIVGATGFFFVYILVVWGVAQTFSGIRLRLARSRLRPPASDHG